MKVMFSEFELHTFSQTVATMVDSLKLSIYQLSLCFLTRSKSEASVMTTPNTAVHSSESTEVWEQCNRPSSGRGRQSSVRVKWNGGRWQDSFQQPCVRSRQADRPEHRLSALWQRGERRWRREVVHSLLCGGSRDPCRGDLEKKPSARNASAQLPIKKKKKCLSWAANKDEIEWSFFCDPSASPCRQSSNWSDSHIAFFLLGFHFSFSLPARSCHFCLFWWAAGQVITSTPPLIPGPILPDILQPHTFSLQVFPPLLFMLHHCLLGCSPRRTKPQCPPPPPHSSRLFSRHTPAFLSSSIAEFFPSVATLPAPLWSVFFSAVP